jgi:hypothetical protein
MAMSRIGSDYIWRKCLNISGWCADNYGALLNFDIYVWFDGTVKRKICATSFLKKVKNRVRVPNFGLRPNISS